MLCLAHMGSAHLTDEALYSSSILGERWEYCHDISQCSPAGLSSNACLTPRDMKRSKCGSTAATKTGHDGQRLAIAVSD